MSCIAVMELYGQRNTLETPNNVSEMLANQVSFVTSRKSKSDLQEKPEETGALAAMV